MIVDSALAICEGSQEQSTDDGKRMTMTEPTGSARPELRTHLATTRDVRLLVGEVSVMLDGARVTQDQIIRGLTILGRRHKGELAEIVSSLGKDS